MKRIAITGVTIAGNMGGAAMLAAVRDILANCGQLPVIDLLSITPGKDRAEPSRLHADVNVVNAHFLLLLLVYLPLIVLLAPVARLRPARWLLARVGYFRSLLEACVVVDLSGIAFVDGRGLPLLAYNVACTLPASLLGVPVVKVAQALGPFDHALNRFAAKQVLTRCKAVIARGDITARHLQQLGVACEVHADITFAMEVSEEDRKFAQLRLAPHQNSSRPLVILSPSEVARRLAYKADIDFIEEFRQLVLDLEKKGYQPVLLPHSYGEGRSKNNDVDLAKSIHAALGDSLCKLVVDVRDPRQLRALIGMADLFVGCRFHSVVAALSMAVPAITIGWSHKYAEMAATFGAERFVVPVENFSAQAVMLLAGRLELEQETIQPLLVEASNRMKEDAERNLDHVRDILAARRSGSC